MTYADSRLVDNTVRASIDEKVVGQCPTLHTEDRSKNGAPEPVLVPEVEHSRRSQACLRLNDLDMPRTIFSVANHGSQNSGSQITRRVDRVSRLHAERNTDHEDSQADYEGDEPCGWRDVFSVSSSENGDYKHGRAQKLTIVIVSNNALQDLHNLLTSEKKQPAELM